MASDPEDSPVRQEQDSLGGMSLPARALHGIHTARALENFPLLGRPVHPALARAFGAVKLAAARTVHCSPTAADFRTGSRPWAPMCTKKVSGLASIRAWGLAFT